MSSRRDKALEAALKYATRGQHDKAAREYQIVVDEDPKDLRSWLLLAECLSRSGQTDKAIARYLQVARTYADDSQNEKALAVYRQVLAIDNERMDVHLKCAQLYRNLRRTAEAIEAYETVAQACLRRGNNKDAISLYRNVIELDPHSINRRLRFAELYSREKMVDEAVAEFRTCAIALREDGQDAQFIRVAERLLYHAEDREILRELIQVYISSGEARRALIKLNELLQRNPSDLEGLELLAETFIALGKNDKALSVILELVRSARTDDRDAHAIAIRSVKAGLAVMPRQPDLRAALERFEGPDDVPEVSSSTLLIEDEDIEEFEGSDVIEPYELSPGDVREVSEISEVIEADEVDDVDDLREFDELSQADLTGSEVAEVEEDEVSSTVVWRAETQLAQAPVAAKATNKPTTSLSDEDLQQLEEARVLVKYRLFEYADSHLDPLLKKAGGDPRLLEVKVNALEDSGQAEQANDWRVRWATVAYEDGQPADASARLAPVLERSPQHAGAKRLSERIAAKLRARTNRADAAVKKSVAATTAALTNPPNSADSGTLASAQGKGQADPFGFDLELPSPAPTDPDDFAIKIEYPSSASVEEPAPEENRFDLPSDDYLSETGPILLPIDSSLDHINRDASSASGSSAQFGTLFDEVSAAVQLPMPDQAGPSLELPLPDELSLPEEPTAREEAPDPSLQPSQLAPHELEIELGELDFFLAENLLSDAEHLLIELLERFERHPVLVPYEAALASAKAQAEQAEQASAPHIPAETVGEPVGDEQNSVQSSPQPAVTARVGLDPAEQLISDEDAEEALSFLEEASKPLFEDSGFAPLPSTAQPPASSPSPAAAATTSMPVDDDEEDYLAAIFNGPSKKNSESGAGARVETDQVAGDPSASFDLGLAYREMGLWDSAIGSLELSAGDNAWIARARVVMAEIERERGNLNDALSHANIAVDNATNEDELAASRYERGLIRGVLEDYEAAISDLEMLPPGFRDAEEKVSMLRRLRTG